MYLKAINQEIIKFPYTIFDLRNDNPNTSFPEDIINRNYDEELQSYNVYKVIIQVQPPITENQYLVQENLPELINNQWILGWKIIDKTNEQLRQEKSNPVQFKKDLNSNSLWQEWTDLIIANNPKQLIFLLEAFNNYIATGDNTTVQNLYNSVKISIPLPENANVEWSLIAENNGIDLIF